MYKLDFKRAEEPEIKLPTSIRSHRKQGIPKKSISASLATLKSLTVWITTNWTFSRDWNSRLPYLPPEKPVCKSRGNSENQTWNNELI